MTKYKLIGTALVSAGAVIGVREYLKPRDIQSLLKWNGVNLISSKEGWESAFYENKDNLEGLGVKDADGLWKWCAERFSYGVADSSIVASVEKYCQDNPKTIFGHIVRAGEKDRIIKPKDSFAAKVVYVLSSDKEKLAKVISLDNAKDLNYDQIGIKVNEWCNAQQKANVRDAEHLRNFKKYCYDIKVKTVKDLLTKEGHKLLEKTEDYKKRFTEELNKVAELPSQIRIVLKAKREAQLKEWNFRKERYKNYTEEQKEIEEKKIIREDKDITDEEIRKNDGQWFKWYCEDKYDEDLTGTGGFPETYQRVKSRCTVKK